MKKVNQARRVRQRGLYVQTFKGATVAFIVGMAQVSSGQSGTNATGTPDAAINENPGGTMIDDERRNSSINDQPRPGTFETRESVLNDDLRDSTVDVDPPGAIPEEDSLTDGAVIGPGQERGPASMDDPLLDEPVDPMPLDPTLDGDDSVIDPFSVPAATPSDESGAF